MKQLIFDVEGDSLTPTRIWCLAGNAGNGVKQTTSYKIMREQLLSSDVLIGHNITRFDIPVLEKLLKIKITAKIVDTIAISWYLYPTRLKHGLEEWGEELGIKKPPIIRWDDPDMIDEYVHRCIEDVKINTKLWNKMWKHLMAIYKDEELLWKFLDYLSFKMDCAREQERSGWLLDKELCTTSLIKLEEDKKKAVDGLRDVMPKVPIIVKKARPAKPYKADGSYSVHGAVWFKRLKDEGLEQDYDGVVNVVSGYDDPNPASTQQVKKWLFDSGWEPITFKFDKDDDGNIRKIPQINLEHGGGICPSIKRLYDKHPEFKLLEGLGVVSHRISILSGFLVSVDAEGYVKAQISGITNTLRFKHKTIVNLPKVGKPYGDVIRGCLIAPEGMELCGSDQSSLEDRLKQHFIWPHDPDFVREMLAEDYDPHLSLALLAKEITELQMAKYKSKDDMSIKPIRDIFKNGNYACQYGAGPPRLALTANITVGKAKLVWEAYWKKNWAIKEVAKEQEVVTVKGQMWLRNPINGFYYSLRYEKDIFSTLVQGSASYVFDLWVEQIRKERPQLTASFHDEIVLCVKKGFREKCTDLLLRAIKKTNDILKLNRELAVSIDYGDNYAQIH